MTFTIYFLTSQNRYYNAYIIRYNYQLRLIISQRFGAALITQWVGLTSPRLHTPPPRGEVRLSG